MDFKLEYDASSRTFKLVDQESRILLEGDALYDLQFPFLFELSHNTSAQVGAAANAAWTSPTWE